MFCQNSEIWGGKIEVISWWMCRRPSLRQELRVALYYFAKRRTGNVMACRGKSSVRGRAPNFGRCSILYKEVMRSELEECKSVKKLHNYL